MIIECRTQINNPEFDAASNIQLMQLGIPLKEEDTFKWSRLKFHIKEVTAFFERTEDSTVIVFNNNEFITDLKYDDIDSAYTLYHAEKNNTGNS